MKKRDVHAAQGSLGEALDAYRSALATADRLRQADPRNMAWQHAVAGLSIKIGNVLAARGDRPGALAAYADALAVADSLARSDPGKRGGKASWQPVTKKSAMPGLP